MALPNAMPSPPYYAVIFSSRRAVGDDEAYAATAQRLKELAQAQPGFLGIESVRDVDGSGITVSYWESLEAIEEWGQHAEHQLAQSLGRDRWYEEFSLRICKVESVRSFPGKR